MKTILLILSLLTCFAGAKTIQTAFPGQTMVDGVMEFKPENMAKMTLVGPAAKSFFDKISESRVTSIQPTGECLKVVVKSGDNMDCGHCVERPKQKNAMVYWCTLNFDTQYGKILGNPTFAPVVPGK